MYFLLLSKSALCLFLASCLFAKSPECELSFCRILTTHDGFLDLLPHATNLIFHLLFSALPSPRMHHYQFKSVCQCTKTVCYSSIIPDHNHDVSSPRCLSFLRACLRVDRWASISTAWFVPYSPNRIMDHIFRTKGPEWYFHTSFLSGTLSKSSAHTHTQAYQDART